MAPPPPTSTLFPTRRSSDLAPCQGRQAHGHGQSQAVPDRQAVVRRALPQHGELQPDRKSTRLNSSHVASSYAVFCLKKKNTRWISADGGNATLRRIPT